jgi:hypothetical protein
MTGAIILFAISILGLVIMFWLKIHELSSGKALYPAEVRDSADLAVKTALNKASIMVSKAGKVPVKDISAKAVQRVGVGVYKIYDKTRKSDNKLSNFVRGRKVLSRNNKRSDFLDTIEEYKRENGGGEIES